MTSDIEDPPVIDYRLVSAIIQQLPRDGVWTADQRERWLAMMTAAVDLMCDVVETKP